MTVVASLPSAAVDAATWRSATAELIDLARALIRIPSIVPVPDGGDGELRAASLVAEVLADVGVPSEIVESAPGRASIAARLRGEDSDLPPLLLMAHHDVVPVTDGWTHDPFGADIADGFIWGRGAVDMKAMVAMEVAVLRRLAREARAAGRDPATDPIPGLRRDVAFLSVADEEAGGGMGAGWIAANRPELLRAAAAVNECGGVTVHAPGATLYPVQVAEKGVAILEVIVHGEPGHGSMPRDRNAAVLAAEVIRRLAQPGPVRVTASVRRFIDEASAVVTPEAARILALLAEEPERAEPILARTCDPATARLLRAIVRDTTSPNVVQAGVKGNVIPGVARLEVDLRPLPGATRESVADELIRRIGPDLAACCDVTVLWYGPPVETSPDHDLYQTIAAVVPVHDPGAVVVPMMAPFSTDAKHAATQGTPTFGFSPLRLPPGEAFLDRFHGVDERISMEGLAWGLPVLYDVVRRYCGPSD